jgi:hypothetical protein
VSRNRGSHALGDGPVALFVELDLPIFIDDTGVTLTVQPQMGVAF